MAIVEFQFRKQAFLDYFKAEINRQRLPFPTLDVPFLPKLKGHLLEQIECLNCTAEATAGDGQITINAELAIHYHTSFATIQAAGSLKRAVTEQQLIAVPVVISVKLIAQPGQAPEPQLQWLAASGLLPPGIVPLGLPAGLNVQSAAVEASEDVIAIRLGTQPDDPVNAPITSRLGNSDWSQLISGQLIANQITANLSTTLASSLSDKLEMSKSPSGDWLPNGIPIIGWNAPGVLASAEVTAVDQCLFDIDISVSLSLIAQFEVSGHTLLTTLTLNWDADSTLCDVVGTLLLTPIGGIAIHVIAEDKASDAILGKAGTPERFHKIGDTDHSITYQSSSFISGPSSSFMLTHSEVNGEGLLITGVVQNRPLPRGLQGSVSVPASELDRDCGKKRVTVKFLPAQVFLNDIGMDGPPKVFPGGILFNPAGAWVAVPGASNDWLDLMLTFADPPSGRLPVGTATSVILDTDCGVRWVDLGVIPPDHEQPTEGVIAEMISQCMSISDPWGDGVMNLDWLVDWPRLLHEFDPVRQWTIGIRDLPEDVRLEFVAVGPDGEKRVIGATGGRQNIAAQITTSTNETLQIRMAKGLSAPAPVVFQRWIVPFASLPLENAPSAISASDGMVGIRGPNRDTQIVQIAASGVLSTQRLNGEQQLDPSLSRLVKKLAREEKRNREPWAATAAQLDRQTVAVAHGQELLIGTVGPMTKM
jgi:hypothetical protein